MAKFVYTNAYVSVAGVDLSDHCARAIWTESVSEQTSTGFGTGYEERLAGLKTAQVQIDFLQDLAVGSVFATVNQNLGGTATVIIRPNGSAAGSTNPGRTGVFLISTLTHGGAVGDVATQQVSWNSTGSFGTA